MKFTFICNTFLIDFDLINIKNILNDIKLKYIDINTKNINTDIQYNPNFYYLIKIYQMKHLKF
jgi:hypothetical protein